MPLIEVVNNKYWNGIVIDTSRIWGKYPQYKSLVKKPFKSKIFDNYERVVIPMNKS